MNYIGIDLGGTNIKGALVSAEGEILKEHSIPSARRSRPRGGRGAHRSDHRTAL